MASNVNAQEIYQQTHIKLNDVLNENESYECKATTSIKLLPGFQYRPNKTKSLNLKIDRYSVFPPCDGYYGGVTDEGVVQFEMLNPLDVNEIVTEYTKMKDFESIMDIFKKMILIVHANVPEGQVRTINIERVELGLMRVSEPNSLDTGVIVPVWDFYGHLDGTSNGTTHLTINAIDGSIIDRRVGY